jgi:FMN phosphatase YigB (HAD superfamily)
VIKAILLDLDDTLILSNFTVFFPTYLEMLGQYGSGIVPADTFIGHVMEAYTQALYTYDPTRPLYDRFFDCFSDRVDRPRAELEPLFSAFYVERYPELEPLVKARPSAPALLNWLTEHDYRSVVATNPGLPEISIAMRMRWGGVDPDGYPFALITSIETMHFGKPQPEYFEEILLRMDVDAGEAIMVGDNWDDDIVGAGVTGLNTFWITEDGSPPPDAALAVDGHGSFAEFSQKVQSGWLETLQPRPITPETLVHRLAAFPAAIDHLRRSYSCEVLECCPGEHEWSVRDIICHLCDHEAEEDRTRLERIVKEDNPFLSANYDPWAHAHEYAAVSVEDALAQFIHHRSQTVDWLKSLPDDVWKRPARYSIMGPTCFGEMVRFTTEHDRTHLRQMRDAIAYALAVRDSEEDA